MAEFTPVSTKADLDTIDDAECVAGYFDGLRGEPEPGNNRTRSYWHGWRNGMVDSHRRQSDEHQRRLAHACREETAAQLFGGRAS